MKKSELHHLEACNFWTADGIWKKYAAYERLAYISDTYGPRLWGSDSLEQVILEIHKMAKEVGFDDVHL